MASENLVNDLFEIVQLNSKEKLSYNDFEKDLFKNINLPKDEIDRALSIILLQAEVNPNVIGESKGGTFILSPTFSASVIATIKYENQFIEGKAEYIEKNVNTFNRDDNFGISDIIMTEFIIDNMLDNYENLSDEEKGDLLSSFTNMTEEQKDTVVEKHNQSLSELENSPNVSEETKRTVKRSMQTNKFVRARAKRAKNGDKESVDAIKEHLKKFLTENKAVFDVLFSCFFHGKDVDIDDLPVDLILEMDNMRLAAVMQAQRIVAKDDKEKSNGDVLKVDTPQLSEETKAYLKKKFPYANEVADTYQLIDVKEFSYNPQVKETLFEPRRTEQYIELKSFLEANDKAYKSINLVKTYGKSISKTFQMMFDEMQGSEEEKIKLMVMYANLLISIPETEKDQIADTPGNAYNILLSKAPDIIGAENVINIKPLLKYDFDGKLPELLYKEPTELAAVLATFLMKQVDGKDEKEQEDVLKFVEHLKGIRSKKSEIAFDVSYMYVEGEEQLKLKIAEKSKNVGKESKNKEDKKLNRESIGTTALGENDEISNESEEKGGQDMFGELDGFSDDSEEKGGQDMFGELDGFSDDSDEKDETDMHGNLKGSSYHLEDKPLRDYAAEPSVDKDANFYKELPVEEKKLYDNKVVYDQQSKKYGPIFDPTAKDKTKDILKKVRFGEIIDENDAVRKAAEIMAKNMEKDETEEIKD